MNSLASGAGVMGTNPGSNSSTRAPAVIQATQAASVMLKNGPILVAPFDEDRRSMRAAWQ